MHAHSNNEQSRKLLIIDSIKRLSVSFNVGPFAGLTVDHVHIHAIPRYGRGMEDPAGGVKHVTPERGKY